MRTAMMSRALVLVAMVGSSLSQLQTVARQYAQESFLPIEPWQNTADPTARVFNGRLFVYTSWDHSLACGPKWSKPQKKQGSQRFCMVGYRAYSTSDPTLRGGWKSHGAVLIEENVPWVSRGGAGWKAAARMWAPCVVRGNDKKFYLFFPAPRTNSRMAIGVAVSNSPTGPFVARPNPIDTPFTIDPSVVKLPNGKWVMFTSSSGEIWVQTLDNGFWKAGPRSKVQGLFGGYKEGPFAEIRAGRLMLQYAQDIGGYSIQQAVANNRINPFAGFKNLGVAVGKLHKGTNHGSVVSYSGRSWAFYHRHFEGNKAPWRFRKVVFRQVTFTPAGKQNPIYPPRTR